MKKIAVFVFVFFQLIGKNYANNLVMGTPTINGSTVSFTIKWDNSWYVTSGPSNWDAVWVFLKRQTCNQGAQNPWSHAMLSSSGHSVTGGQLTVDIASDNEGVFIRRSGSGMGSITQSTVTLTLASPIGADNINLYGIEMVYIPQGSFYIGDGAYNSYQTLGNSSGNPVQITGNNSMTSTSYGGRNNLGSTVDLPNTYPFGYNSFYCMKYEITAGLYTSFLNTLTYNQQLHKNQDMDWNSNPPTSPAGTSIMNDWGYNIKIKTPAISTTVLQPAVYACDANNNNIYNEDCDGLALPVSLRQEHWLAFMEWAALRPMTEFEYEKACRGPLTPVYAEYSWGSTDLAQMQYTNSDWGCSTDIQTYFALGLCNCWTGRMYRVGSSATQQTDRVHAGATYYGVLDMTGSTYERCVGGWGYDYSTYTTANGDGNINSDGFCAMTVWNNMQYWNRGGSAQNSQSAQLSNRNYGNDVSFRQAQAGRGVRSN
jgi:formylglycine-generating enzyme required for sulfatase activity